MTTETRMASARICLVRVCLVYDCLYPYTVGGAERWYRNLAERLAARGHEVTYLTRRQWDGEADVPDVRVLAVAPRMDLYANGRRRLLPPLAFGLGVLRHLLRHGRKYDVVHTASFPYFPLLAAGAARRRGAYRIVVDWHEVWTRSYWRRYAGRLAGELGWRVQRACLRVPQSAFCFSRLHEDRLRAADLAVTRLEGQYAGPAPPEQPRPARAVAVYAGRHLPEKRVPALVAALARIPDLEGELYGDGPDRPNVLSAIAAAGLDSRVRAPGFVERSVLDDALATAECFVLPSEREGYGLVVVESAANGVPAVVVAGPENAATELVEDGINGAVAASAEPDELAAAIQRARGGLRDSTLAWYRRNEERLSLDGSLERVLETYGG
jgi:glycosyltransferase involved in cell wall biosynthesis